MAHASVRPATGRPVLCRLKLDVRDEQFGAYVGQRDRRSVSVSSGQPKPTAPRLGSRDSHVYWLAYPNSATRTSLAAASCTTLWPLFVRASAPGGSSVRKGADCPADTRGVASRVVELRQAHRESRFGRVDSVDRRAKARSRAAAASDVGALLARHCHFRGVDAACCRGELDAAGRPIITPPRRPVSRTRYPCRLAPVRAVRRGKRR